MKALLRENPRWPRPAVELAWLQGPGTPESQATLAAAVAAAAVEPVLDPAGLLIAKGMQLAGDGKFTEALPLYQQGFEQDPLDARAGLLLASTQSRLSHVAARDAILEALWRSHPELEFGQRMIGALRANGRDDAADARVASWIDAAPASAMAADAATGVDLAHGRFDAAEQSARRSMVIRGETSDRLIVLCDALLLAGKSEEARQVAAQLSLLSPHDKALAQRRVAILELMDGRFAAAYAAFEEAAEMAKEDPFVDDLYEILDVLRALAPMVSPHDADQRDEAAAQFFEKIAQPRFGRIARLARELRNAPPGKCPALDSAWADMPEGSRRENIRRLVLREAAMVGCASCAEVVQAGASPQEPTSRAVYQLGICAEREGALPLARDAFRLANSTGLDEVEGGLISGDPLWAMRARLHLGKVLARMGDSEGARALLDRFVKRWQHADRPVPELAEAQAALAALPALVNAHAAQ
jgi:tetratricopeptide (TPR) repeat protein